MAGVRLAAALVKFGSLIAVVAAIDDGELAIIVAS